MMASKRLFSYISELLDAGFFPVAFAVACLLGSSWLLADKADKEKADSTRVTRYGSLRLAKAVISDGKVLYKGMGGKEGPAHLILESEEDARFLSAGSIWSDVVITEGKVVSKQLVTPTEGIICYPIRQQDYSVVFGASGHLNGRYLPVNCK